MAGKTTTTRFPGVYARECKRRYNGKPDVSYYYTVQQDGKKIWETQKEKVTNVDLKKMVEAYKTKDQNRDTQQQDRKDRPRESFKEKLEDRKIKVVAMQSNAPKQQHDKSKAQAL